jgi:hypothetical protein
MVLAVGELVIWYGMFAPAGRNDGTTGLPARGAPFLFLKQAIFHTEMFLPKVTKK